MTDKQIIIDGVDVNSLCHDQITCMNRYEVATLFIKTVELLVAKEQECEELKKIINEAKNSKLDLKSFLVGEAVQNEYEQQLDQLKAEVKSKTEYIQEQRDIINQYSKEIEMYKKCQGKRASKREEELKAENDELKVMFKDLSYENQKFSYQIEEQTKQLEPFKDEYFKGLETIVIAELAKKSIRIIAENRKLEQTLTEIKEIAKKIDPLCIYEDWKCTDLDNTVECPAKAKCPRECRNKILQKISECEGDNEHS